MKQGNVVAVSDKTYVEHGTVSKLVVAPEAQSVVVETGAMVYEVKNDSENFIIKQNAFVGSIDVSSSQQPSSGSVNTDGIISVSTFEQFQTMALTDQVGISLAGKTIKLLDDIDMTGREWTPFGYSKTIPFFWNNRWKW